MKSILNIKTIETLFIYLYFCVCVCVCVCVCTSVFSGRLVIGSSTFGIEPLEGSSDFEHVVYRLEDEETEPLSCGTTHAHRHDDNDTSSTDQTIGHSHSDLFGETVSHLIRVSVCVC